jgi:hypothetical protein
MSADEQQRVLLEAQEIASVRGMVPIEELPEIIPASPASATQAATHACLECGKVNPAGNRFCEGCGQPLQALTGNNAIASQVGPSTPSASSYNPWLDTEPVTTPAQLSRAKTARASASAPTAPARAATAPTTKDDNFFYFYDDTKAPRQNRKLLVILLIVFAVGIAGMIYLMLRSPAKSATTGNVTIAISPTSANISPGEGFDFAATVTGTGDTDVTWSVQEGNSAGRVINRGAQAQGGKVASIGVFVAPDTPGTYHVVAASKADPTKSATAEVLVNGK